MKPKFWVMETLFVLAMQLQEQGKLVSCLGGSALLMRGRADAPVFTSAADGSLSQPNSSIFVVDPFGSNQLTDTTVSEINEDPM